MPDYSAALPQLQNPDLLGAYIRGQQMSVQQQMQQQQMQARQQDSTEHGLRIDQLRAALPVQQMMAKLEVERANQALHPAPQAAPGAQSWSPLTPQSQGSSASTDKAIAMLQGKDPDVYDAQIQESRRKLAQENAYGPDGPLALFSQFRQNPQALAALGQNTSLLPQYAQQAKRLGYSPIPKSNEEVQQVAALLENEGRSQLGLPPVPVPGTDKQGSPPAALQEYQYAQQQGFKGSFVQYQQMMHPRPTADKASFTPEMGQLMAAFTDHGVVLPTGFRGKEQIIANLQGLLERHPDMTPDQIALGVKSGKLSMTGETREAATAGNIVGKVKYAENELSQSIPLAREASAAVPRGNFIPLTKLLQMKDTSISDPALVNFKVKAQSVMNAYDMLAARSGTDVEKRAEQHRLLMTAQSPAAFESALKAMEQKAQVAHKAGDMSLQQVSGTGGSAHPDDIQALLKKYGH